MSLKTIIRPSLPGIGRIIHRGANSFPQALCFRELIFESSMVTPPWDHHAAVDPLREVNNNAFLESQHAGDNPRVPSSEQLGMPLLVPPLENSSLNVARPILPGSTTARSHGPPFNYPQFMYPSPYPSLTPFPIPQGYTPSQFLDYTSFTPGYLPYLYQPRPNLAPPLNSKGDPLRTSQQPPLKGLTTKAHLEIPTKSVRPAKYRYEIWDPSSIEKEVLRSRIPKDLEKRAPAPLDPNSRAQEEGTNNIAQLIEAPGVIDRHLREETKTKGLEERPSLL